MTNITNSITGNAPGDLLKETTPAVDVASASASPDARSNVAAHSTGILPSHELEHLVRVTKDIYAVEPIEPKLPEIIIFPPASG